MADLASTAPTAPAARSGSGAAADPGERGRLVVADRVVERLARHAASGIGGVTPARRDLLDRAVGRDLPRADAHISGRVAAIDLDIAAEWGAPLAEVAGRVRHTVKETLQTLAGLDVTRVNVTVKHIVRDDTQEPRVR